MARGKAKRISESDRKAVLAETTYVNGEPKINMKGARILCNALIDEGSGNLERSMSYLQAVNDQLKKPRTLVPCSFCGRKLGLKRCSGCSLAGGARYCSRECQLEGWPEHKFTCHSRQPLHDMVAQT